MLSFYNFISGVIILSYIFSLLLAAFLSCCLGCCLCSCIIVALTWKYIFGSAKSVPCFRCSWSLLLNHPMLQSKASGILLPKGITRCILLCRGDLLLFQKAFSSGNNYLKLEKGHLNFSQISVYRCSNTNVSFDKTTFTLGKSLKWVFYL